MVTPKPRVVADLMTMDPLVVAVDATIDEAEDLIRTHRVSGLPVVDADGVLVGVVSQTDFVYLEGPDVRSLIRNEPSRIRVGEVMSRPAITVDMTTPLIEAARKMSAERIHRLVVIDKEQRPIGVLSAMDFVGLFALG